MSARTGININPEQSIDFITEKEGSIFDKLPWIDKLASDLIDSDNEKEITKTIKEEPVIAEAPVEIEKVSNNMFYKIVKTAADPEQIKKLNEVPNKAVNKAEDYAKKIFNGELDLNDFLAKNLAGAFKKKVQNLLDQMKSQPQQSVNQTVVPPVKPPVKQPSQPENPPITNTQEPEPLVAPVVPDPLAVSNEGTQSVQNEAQPIQPLQNQTEQPIAQPEDNLTQTGQILKDVIFQLETAANEFDQSLLEIQNNINGISSSIFNKKLRVNEIKKITTLKNNPSYVNLLKELNIQIASENMKKSAKLIMGGLGENLSIYFRNLFTGNKSKEDNIIIFNTYKIFFTKAYDALNKIIKILNSPYFKIFIDEKQNLGSVKIPGLGIELLKSLEFSKQRISAVYKEFGEQANEINIPDLDYTISDDGQVYSGRGNNKKPIMQIPINNQKPQSTAPLEDEKNAITLLKGKGYKITAPNNNVVANKKWIKVQGA